MVAWNRFPWFECFQEFTFTPLWVGYILVINALTYRRAGHCMLLDRTGYFLALFPLSAVFWWSFEYINRFVENWHYMGAGNLGPWKYLLLATLPFSTVLPAVLGTVDWLRSFPRLSAGLGDFRHIKALHSRRVPWLLLGLGAAGLIGIPIWPTYLFPLVWVAPLLLITGLQMLAGGRTPLAALTLGNWQPVWRAALAGLVCGFFWELWNVNSLAHWEYSIPYVHRFTLFEMPLLGYAGYLPFGVTCVAFADFVLSSCKRAKAL